MKDILVTFDKPISGWWDGGPKSQGTFIGEIVRGGYDGHESLKQHVKWGCWEFNHWIRRPLGKTPEKSMAAYLRKTMRVPKGNYATVRILKEKS